MKTIHGGDIYRNRVQFDYSVNMNPLGIPESVKQALYEAVEQCHSYPDIHAQELKKALAEMIGAEERWILFGNGASELFIAIVHGLKPKKIVIPVPSFYGYEHAASAVAEDVIYYEMKEEEQFCPDEALFSVLTEAVDLLFLANPNNPTGGQIAEEYLKRLFEHCQKNKIVVVLDECFIEFCEEAFCGSLELLEEFQNVILVRAFTKIFTIPGVRLGYLLCANEEMRHQIARQIPEWNISTFAQKAGIACTKETEFVSHTRSYLKEERRYLREHLESMNELACHVYPSASNFLLLRTDRPFYCRLLEREILVRDCSNFRGLGAGYYRVAVKSHAENEHLLKVIGEINWNE